MKFTEGAFRDYGYALAQKEFGAELVDGGPWMKFKNPKTGSDIVVKDVIADAFLQQILLRPAEYDVIATLNLNGDYISDALAAQVGGIGIAPGANLSDSVAMFEATHGTAPKYAGKDYVNPGSEILSAEMMLRHLGWTEAADIIIKSMEAVDSAKARHVRLRASDGRRDAGFVFGLWSGADREYVSISGAVVSVLVLRMQARSEMVGPFSFFTHFNLRERTVQVQFTCMFTQYCSRAGWK